MPVAAVWTSGVFTPGVPSSATAAVIASLVARFDGAMVESSPWSRASDHAVAEVLCGAGWHMKGLPVRGEPDGHAADSAFGQLHRPLARLLCRLVDQPPQGMAGFERLDGRVGGAIGGGDGLA